MSILIIVFILGNVYAVLMMMASARNDRRSKAAIKKMTRQGRD